MSTPGNSLYTTAATRLRMKSGGMRSFESWLTDMLVRRFVAGGSFFFSYPGEGEVTDYMRGFFVMGG